MIEFSKAMNKLQSEMIVVGKNAEGYGYSYADLPHLIEKLYPLMTKHGFSAVQMPDSSEDGKPVLATTVLHVSGESMIGIFPVPDAGMSKQNAAQNMGSALTYCRRYALAAAFGVPIADDDAASLNVTEQQPVDNRGFEQRGRNPRDDMNSRNSYTPGQKSEKPKDLPDHEAKEITAKKEYTCLICGQKGEEGSQLAFKREGGKPYIAHWGCHIDTELAKEK